jgi:hypothetical protein
MIDNWRWAGVPFYLRTGKALAALRSEVVIQFKQAPFALFRDTPVERLTPNDMSILIQPEECVTLRFSAKIPGPSVRMDGVAMKFNYREHFNAAPNTGYETLIYDCMNGDPTLFQRADNIEAGWRVVQPVLDAWGEERATELPVYPAGSSGPRRPTRFWSATIDIGAPSTKLISCHDARSPCAVQNLRTRLGCRRDIGDRRQAFDRAHGGGRGRAPRMRHHFRRHQQPATPRVAYAAGPPAHHDANWRL